MSNHIYKKIELVGSSEEGTDDAVKNALAKAAKSVRNMRWFEVKELRGHIDDQQVKHWQVTLKMKEPLPLPCGTYLTRRQSQRPGIRLATA